jgi:hypothetical protein
MMTTVLKLTLTSLDKKTTKNEKQKNKKTKKQTIKLIPNAFPKFGPRAMLLYQHHL